MTIARVKPAGWSTNETLSSAQSTALDTALATALDKTVAGDTLSGVVAIAATGKLSTSGGGSFELKNNDFVKLGAGHTALTQTRTKQACAGVIYGTAWTIGITSVVRHVLIGAATTDFVAISLNELLQNGETVTSVGISFSIPTSHLPAVQPAIVFEKYKTDASNVAIGNISLTAANAAAYFNGGALQSLTKTGLSEVVDKTQYAYVLLLADENGAASVAGNKYFHVTVVSTIADVQPF